jgi:quercetin dioxygenase-like cupin family protein/DNA-binding XRE family transcriptional regulator
MATSAAALLKSTRPVLAERLARLRIERGWTLAELAEKCGFSKPFLSRLESGARQPSLGALLTLGRIYQTPLHALLETGEPQRMAPVVIRKSGASIQRSNGLRYRPISGSGALLNLSAMRVTVPRRRRHLTLSHHDGEELLYVIDGELSLVFENESHTLRPGDAAHFDARLPHRLSASGERDAEVLLVAYVPAGRAKAGGRSTETATAQTSRSRGTVRRSTEMGAICASLEDPR